jgi:hypothetical protein
MKYCFMFLLFCFLSCKTSNNSKTSSVENFNFSIIVFKEMTLDIDSNTIKQWELNRIAMKSFINDTFFATHTLVLIPMSSKKDIEFDKDIGYKRCKIAYDLLNDIYQHKLSIIIDPTNYDIATTREYISKFGVRPVLLNGGWYKL